MDIFNTVHKDIDVKKDKSKLSRVIEDPIIYSNSANPSITFVVDKWLSKKQIEQFQIDVLNTIYEGVTFQILYAFKVKPRKGEVDKNISSYYRTNMIDATKYIKPFSRIITFGRAMYTLCHANTDLNVKSFYDIIFNDTFFYSLETKSKVYPVDDLFTWLDKDTFSRFFALRQIKECLESKPTRVSVPKLNLIKVLGEEEVKQFLWGNMEAKVVAGDLETSGFSFIDSEIGCYTCAFDGITGYYLRWSDIEKNKELFNQFLSNKYQVYANGKFDIKFMRYRGISNAKIDFDTLNAGHVLNEMRSNSLKSHAYYYTWMGGYDRGLEAFKRKYKKLKNYLEIPEDILSEYAIYDPIATFQTYLKEKAQLEKISKMDIYSGGRTLGDYYYDAVIPALNTYTDIEMDGVHYDWVKLEILSVRVQKEINQLKLDVFKALGVEPDSVTLSFDDDLEDSNYNDLGEFIAESVFDFNGKASKGTKELNVDSNMQIGKLLESKGWSNQGRNKTGVYNVNDSSLDKWAKEGHKEAELLVELHKLNTVYKTFIGSKEDNSGFFKYKSSDGLIHPTYAVMLKNSGRNGCTNPNLQNIKARGYLAEEIRSCFITPNSEYALTDNDLSGAQLRYIAMVSGDEVMADIFLNLGGDMHTRTGYNIFLEGKKILVDGVMQEIGFEEALKLKKTNPTVKESRQNAKICNFSFCFGTSAFSFATQALLPNWSKEEAIKYVVDNNLQKKQKSLYNQIMGLAYDEEGNLIKKEETDDSRDMFKDIYDKGAFSYYWASAIHVRKKFFETYKGVVEWISNTQDFAKENGFVISPFGTIRRLPQLLYIGKDDERGTIKNLLNTAVNSPIQSMEVFNMNTSITYINEFRKSNNYKTRFFNMIHDSGDMYNHKDELDIFAKVIKETFNKPYKEYNGIPMDSEGEISFPLKEKVEDCTWWGFGSHYF